MKQETFFLLKKHLESIYCVFENQNECLDNHNLLRPYQKPVFKAPFLTMATILFLSKFCDEKMIYFKIDRFGSKGEGEQGIYLHFEF